MLLQAAESAQEFSEWKRNGGDSTIHSYMSANEAGLDVIPAPHWEFIRNMCRDYYETDTHFFVHANVYADLPLDEQPDYMRFWEKFHSTPSPHQSGKIMICGHTPQRDGRPANIGHAVCIDTGACKGGWLTALDVATGQYWQANEAHEFRSDWLE